MSEDKTKHEQAVQATRSITRLHQELLRCIPPYRSNRYDAELARQINYVADMADWAVRAREQLQKAVPLFATGDLDCADLLQVLEDFPMAP